MDYRKNGMVRDEKTRENNQIEYEFSLKQIDASSRKQWSSKFGEYVVRNLLEMTGKNVKLPRKINRLNFFSTFFYYFQFH
jgi:hypothetical protein